MKRLHVVLAGLALILLTAATAAATDYKTDSAAAWAAADRCTREAARLFPDYTPQGNAARENYRRACLRADNLPAPNGQASTSN
ncbi:MAG: hypothetical protein ACREEL_12935 [Stellaceae bacterium]